MVNHNTASSQRCLLQNRIKILIKKELRQDIRHDFVSWQAVSHVTLQVQAHKNVARERLTHWGLQLSLEEWPSSQLDEKGRHLSMIDGTFQRTFSSFLFFILLKWFSSSCIHAHVWWVPTHIESRLVWVTMEYDGGEGVWLSKQAHKGRCAYHFALLDHSLLGKPTTMSWGCLSSPQKKTAWERNWGLLPTAGTNLQAMWVQCWNWILSPSQAFRWLQLQLTSDCRLLRGLEPEPIQSTIPKSWSIEIVR